MTGRRARITKPATTCRALLVLDDGSVQLDLLGEVETELAHRATVAARAAEFEARGTRLPDGSPVMWTAGYDAPTAKRGERVPGWRCWLCGQVVVNAYVLHLTHGLTPDDPDVLTRAHCDRQTPAPDAPEAP